MTDREVDADGPDLADPTVPFDHETVRYDREDGVAVVTIDRPNARNAVDSRTALGLRDAWKRFDTDEEALVGVFTGAGEHFCAGADLKRMDLEDREEGWLGCSRMRVEKPTIAAVEGHAVAGGLELALWCDLRVAAEDATFGCFERRFGVPLVDGGTQRLPRLVGRGRALDMILTGRAVEAAEAHDWGLADRVVEPGETLAAARELAAGIAEHPQTTVRTDRAALYDGLGESLETGLQIEAWHGTKALGTAAEGAARFADGEGRGGEGVE
ncbi:crotonase/enoyl-CoA hydratase family protein [Halomarina oriensis]|uniref:Crotonase/enoyl-CoA hydratase family protein n=1 Tax=Halomarina oriensis TaxID=671145 RepID=A0A6B0GQZ9_9EURY|nr:crotonase/enoyl-CoA hydratase family protein [Halomarina oriensis]MWG34088.1 crotonase/enoyl-CoA hydratase family protein [Halomarina oriensis]